VVAGDAVIIAATMAAMRRQSMKRAAEESIKLLFHLIITLFTDLKMLCVDTDITLLQQDFRAVSLDG